MGNLELPIYNRESSIVFRKTKEEFGGLSNMASGYPIVLDGIRVLSSEALYQSLKFTDVNIQKLIISEVSPMTAKMVSKKYKQYIRSDWDEIKVSVMKWCLKIKLINNWGKFGTLLELTQDYEIVEESARDNFWGAIPISEDLLRGNNYLGRLLKQLRTEYKLVNENMNYVVPKVSKYDLFFMGKICQEVRIDIIDQKTSNYQHREIIKKDENQLKFDVD